MVRYSYVSTGLVYTKTRKPPGSDVRSGHSILLRYSDIRPSETNGDGKGRMHVGESGSPRRRVPTYLSY